MKKQKENPENFTQQVEKVMTQRSYITLSITNHYLFKNNGVSLDEPGLLCKLISREMRTTFVGKNFLIDWRLSTRD